MTDFLVKEDAKKNSTEGRIYDMQRERLLNLKKGIAFQKAFTASVERLKDVEIAKRTRLSSGLYSTNIKDWRNANERKKVFQSQLERLR